MGVGVIGTKYVTFLQCTKACCKCNRLIAGLYLSIAIVLETIVGITSWHISVYSVTILVRPISC